MQVPVYGSAMQPRAFDHRHQTLSCIRRDHETLLSTLSFPTRSCQQEVKPLLCSVVRDGTLKNARGALQQLQRSGSDYAP